MKYEITDIVHPNNLKLRRIRALITINEKVSAGDFGGFVENPENLSQNGNSWIYHDAQVYGFAKVYDDAEIRGIAKVCGIAKVYGFAKVYDDAEIRGIAKVYGDAQVYGNAQVYGDAQVYGIAKVYGNAQVYGNALVRGAAQVSCNDEIIWFSKVGSEKGTLTAYYSKTKEIIVTRGCFTGTIDEFEHRVKEVHAGTKIEKEYLILVKYIKTYFDYQEQNEC